MLPLIAAIPTIISAISAVTALFIKGKDAVVQVTGQPSQASTPAELQTEVSQLPPEQQKNWVEIMAREVEQYKAQNERLSVEIGAVDSTVTGKISAEAANRVTILRMTTRPWAVRWMVRYVLFPFYLVAADVAQNLLLNWLPFLKTRLGIQAYGTFEHVFGLMQIPANADASVLEKFAMLFSSQGGGPSTFAGHLYMNSMPWVVSIILAYMGLRELGKWKGYGAASESIQSANGQGAALTAVSTMLQDGANLAGKIGQWFKR